MTAATYYDNVNVGLLDAIDRQAHRVFEIGCGSGALARAYRARNPEVHYTGLDILPLARAGTDLDVALVCDLNHVADWSSHPNLAAELPLESFDVLVFGDVLEHLIDPDTVLRQAVARLRPGGQVVASVPNVQFWTTWLNLLHGYWPRHDSGLFDRTHLRWFTLDNMREMFTLAGLVIESISARPPNEAPEFKARRDRLLELLAPLAQAEGVDPARLAERARPLQYLFSCRKPAHAQ